MKFIQLALRELQKENKDTYAIFFQGPIGRDILTRVKIRNSLFATFSHTYQLLLYIVDAQT